MTYIGRFAPSPSGRLHFGSVVAALGSYLRAKSLNGKWLIRIEDLDTPRCPPETTDIILQELDALGLKSDGEILIQSHRKKIYEQALRTLLDERQAFFCTCTRAQLTKRPCHCYLETKKNLPHASIRFKPLRGYAPSFHDELQGDIKVNLPDKFITLKRSDGIIAYNLACVTDDALCNVTEIVRGSDLIDVTPIQISLFKALHHKIPDFLHLPLALEANGCKLSKQNHAPAIFDLFTPQEIFIRALIFLGQDTSKINSNASLQTIIDYAVINFNLDKIPLSSQSV
ncbi:tRNA glutamyl-Q(34) synthetase GluQRS [Succinatimonas hippei]|uniref:tRNA glutamyl-Q(34) synthetase GluQRS n=1 Tax=Succinatimonas hippei TaxID=626938 RepID=UPI0023F63C6A|nr:tRNA glutamyl-Q(34) synthetase GluQRS [Succinatimonas hippei]